MLTKIQAIMRIQQLLVDDKELTDYIRSQIPQEILDYDERDEDAESKYYQEFTKVLKEIAIVAIEDLR